MVNWEMELQLVEKHLHGLELQVIGDHVQPVDIIIQCQTGKN